MAVRTNETLVAGIVEWDSVAVPDLSPFIDIANQLVDEICVPLGYSEARLLSIETWLAAHFYAVRDPRTTYEMVRSIAQNYESKVDLGLNLTRFGQQAMLLDTKGGLRSLDQGKTKVIQFKWLGKKECE